ncbi:lactosylceramide 4-alpha-galactosyltransferase-like [Copidosoma floridanum]|uniref:lactosylceramide 4-alpha-galactosyltransferase-like n=1 Tax=Copidosoma floridanum TaxID=29053 RepID=UPI0006C9823D|nr:lactosylceramide 4-alpha-galactosyltransferase-like [Copidosoma floridanum]
MAVTRKRLALLVLCGSAVLVLYATTNDELMREMPIFQPLDMDVQCYKEPSAKGAFDNFDFRAEQARLSSGKNIFFHETSCFGRETNHQLEFNCRQACAVESAARANPGMSVNLLFLSPSAPSNRTRKLLDLLLRYDNVRVKRILVDDYIKESPLERWYEDGVLGTSRWPRSHMSDILRYLTLWRFGGVYLDLDVVIIKSRGCMARTPIENTQGKAKDMTVRRCNGFEVFPPPAFYPIFYKEWQRYFTEEKANETMHLIKQARAIHVWNKLSTSEVVHMGSRVPYALVAEKHCPRAYYGCGATF